MAVSATKYFEDCLDNRLSYYAYRALYGVNGSKVGNRLLRFHPKLADRELLRRKYQENGYTHFFKTARLREAYRLRMYAAIALARAEDGQAAAKAGNYLDVVDCPEVREWLGLESAAEAWLARRPSYAGPLTPVSGSETGLGRILFCGPSADIAGQDFRSYDTIVLMKPIDLGKYGIRPERVLLTLNNQWSIGQKSSVVEWAKAYPEARVLAPNPLGIANESAAPFGAIPRFPFGSFMGLQRALAIILSGFRFRTIELAGFDFSLSEEAYRPWYPSLLLKQYRNHSEAYKDTYRRHDFLLNFMYVRKLAERGIVAGSVLEYTTRPLAEVVAIAERKLAGTPPPFRGPR